MFTVDLPTKPYVHHYISLTYGTPADFSKNKHLNERFRRCLVKPSVRYDSAYKDLSFIFYSSKTSIKISSDDFYRYGWEFTNTDIISFGKYIEGEVKKLMVTIVSLYSIFMSKRDAILLFQKNYGFTEDTWSYDSIKKEYYRNSTKNDCFEFPQEIVLNIEKLIMVKLSPKGTVSHNTKPSHENP